MHLVIILLLILFTSCAGPHHPFGADFFITNEYSVSNFRSVAMHESLQFESEPVQKIYHTPFNLKIKIKSTKRISDKFRYDIIYNKQRVDQWWKNESITISDDKTEAMVEFKDLSFIPGIKNDVEFHFYADQYSAPIIFRFNEPHCPLEKQKGLGHLGSFNNQANHYLAVINQIGDDYVMNPSLLAALVAQESSFNPFAISWAKAIGLTQITPLANRDILQIKQEWQSHPSIENSAYPILKYKIKRGSLNAKNDWRLDPEKSLEGGAIFLKELEKYWQQEQHQSLLKSTFTQIPYEDIILASYNSGAYRVKKNIIKHREQWLWSNELNEARKYVMNIKSYCHHFNPN
jgi:hypothetical protein